MKKFIILLIIALSVSCNSKKENTNELYEEVKSGVFICNEGNFMYGNTSLSVYNNVKNEVQNNVFYNVNSIPLGDVCQSITVIGQRAFVVVNNSGKVVVIDIATMKQIDVISNLTSPRYVLPVNEDKVYISSLQANYITILNPKTLEIRGKIELGTSSEQIILSNGFAYTTQWSYGNKVYKIDTKTDKVVSSLEVASQPNSLTIDKNGKIWVLSDGGYEGSPNGHFLACITKIDPTTFTVEKKFNFSALTSSPSEITTDVSGENIFFINSGMGNFGSKNGIYKMHCEAQSLPENPYITQKNALFYALGVDPYNGDIYVSDAIDYAQKGKVYRYYSNGNLVHSFDVNISPGAFCFFKR